MLQRQCYVFRTPVLPVRTYHRASYSPLQGRHGNLAYAIAGTAPPPAQPLRSCSRIGLGSPALPRSLYPGRRDISNRARKKSADESASTQSCDEPALPNSAAAEDLKSAKRAARKKKADTASAAGQGGIAGSLQGTHGLTDSTDASVLSTEDTVRSATLDEPAAAGEPKPVRSRRRKKQAVTAEASEHDNELTSQQNGQPCIDLHANVPKGTHWHGVESWVAFSDLHVGLRTVDVACQVLRRVKEEAAARNAGILFLGRLSLTSERRSMIRGIRKAHTVMLAIMFEKAGWQPAYWEVPCTGPEHIS